MLSTLQSEDEDVESALIPFLQAYVSKLRNSQKRGSPISQVPSSTVIPPDTALRPPCPLLTALPAAEAANHVCAQLSGCVCQGGDQWPDLLQESRQHVRGILEAVASGAYYPETSSAPTLILPDRSAHALAAAEAEQAAAERRQELFVLFRNGAKIFPEEAYAVVGPRLQALVSEADTDFQVGI